ncbi:MAG: TonB-dependent receptor [Betaproteobacteria bacterium]
MNAWRGYGCAVALSRGAWLVPALAGAALAWGDAVAQGSQAAAGQDQPAVLSPVVVSVTRGVEQKAFDTPASVDVIDGAAMRQGQLQVNLSETLARVPGIVALNRQNYAQDLQISSRGFGARSTFGVRGIRLYADGIPASGPDGQGQVSHFDLASAARVEVLRGPFSALYGNSSGGVISITTEDPGITPVADVGLTFGADGLQRQGLKFGGTQGALQYQLSANHFETEGQRQHSAAQRDNLNAKLRWQSDPDTRVTLVLNAVRMPDTQDPLGLSRSELANPRQATATALTFNTRKSVSQDQLGWVWEQRLSPADTLQLTTYAGQRATVQFQSIPASAQAAASHPGGVIDLDRGYQGLDVRWIRRGQWLERPYTLTAGLSLDRQGEDRRGYQNFTGSGAGQVLGVQGALRRNEANTVRNADQYLQAGWVLSDQFRLMAGLRHSRVNFESRDRYVGTGNGDDSGSARHGATTPVLGLVFHASEALNVYGAWGRGFETPTFNELAYRSASSSGLNFGLASARSRQFELGLKAMLGPDWRSNLAWFQANTSDEIAVLSNTGGRSVFQNVGQTTRRGWEALLSGHIGQDGSAYLSLSSLRASFDDSFLSSGTRVAAGNRLPGVPAMSAYGELAWEHRASGLKTALEWRASSRVFVNDINNDSAASYSILSLRAGLQQTVGAWKLSQFLRLDNLADRAYVGSVIVNESNGRYFEPGLGRCWMLGLNARYGF